MKEYYAIVCGVKFLWNDKLKEWVPEKKISVIEHTSVAYCPVVKDQLNPVNFIHLS